MSTHSHHDHPTTQVQIHFVFKSDSEDKNHFFKKYAETNDSVS